MERGGCHLLELDGAGGGAGSYLDKRTLHGSGQKDYLL